MKKLLILLAAVVFAACSETKDLRPQEQVKFAEQVRTCRDQVNAQNDPTAKRALLEGGVEMIKSFILDTLQTNVNQWQVRVLDVATDKDEISYGMNIDEAEPSEKTRFQSIVLNVKTRAEQADYASASSKLKTGDIVLLTGTFVEHQGHINLNPYKKGLSKNVLDNPAFQAEASKVVIGSDK